MKKNVLLKLICIIFTFFIIFSQEVITFAVTERDESLSGVLQDGSSFIELRWGTRITDSSRRYTNFIK